MRRRAAFAVASGSVAGVSLLALSCIPAWQAMDAFESRLQSDGYEVLRLARVVSPVSPEILYLGCRDDDLVMSAMFRMPERGMFEPPVEEPFKSPTRVALNREPYRLHSPSFETEATFSIGRTYDTVQIGPLDDDQKNALVFGLLGHSADRISIGSLERGLYFSLGAEPATSRAFLQSCGAL